MKKWISLFLAMLMIGVCAAGIAEGTEETGTTAFLRIKEGVTAQVYEKPGDAQAVDSLAGGKLCGLIDTVTTESGDAWFRVFYLNSKGEGVPGYIRAEDADQLTEEELLDQGIRPNTIRLSIGTEHIDDIIADLENGFDAVSKL